MEEVCGKHIDRGRLVSEVAQIPVLFYLTYLSLTPNLAKRRDGDCLIEEDSQWRSDHHRYC